MNSRCTGQDRLSQLPVELLVITLQQCTNFTSLWSLINTSSRLSAIFNARACEIVSTVLNTIPSPTRVLMQAVFSMQKGTFACKSLREARIWGSGHDQCEPLKYVSGTSSQLRCFVRLCHHVHVLAHMAIESCIQRCLKSPLGQRRFPEGFEDPTWTEEQRMLLGFWRFMYWNQLKTDMKRGLLRWTRLDLAKLERWLPYEDSPAVFGKQAYTALFYIEDLIAPGAPKRNLPALHIKSFELLELPKEKEFGWKCQPAPSSLAITQHWQPGEKFHELTAPEVIQKIARLYSAEHDELSDLTHVSCPRGYCNGSSSVKDEGYSSDSSSGSNSGGDINPQTGERLRIRPPHGSTLRYPTSEEDTEIQYWSVLTRHFHDWNPRPVRDFDSELKERDEWFDLGRPPLGLRFWRSMSLDPEGGPAKYMWFEGYIRYGFALWEEKRMIDLGLWSNGIIDDMSEYYQRWYQFLHPEDISRYKVKSRFLRSEDELMNEA